MKVKTLRFGMGFHVVLGNNRAQVAQMVIAPGGSEGDAGNRHRGADQWLYVISGTGCARVGDKRVQLRPGTMLLIEQNDRHEVKNTGSQPLKTLNYYVPPAYTPGGNERPAGRRN